MDIVGVFLPDRCVGCGCEAAGICSACRGAIALIRPPLCARCGSVVAWPVPRCRECAGRRLAFASARAAVAYEGVVPRLVSAWKDGGRRRLARLAADLVAEYLPKPEVEAIAFVPSVRARELWRGYNPAEQLAYELGRRWQLPPRRLLVRARSPVPQRGLPLAGRRQNVAGAFRASSAVPGSLALVDDVYTSGATVAAAAGALVRAGAARVDVVTFARALRIGGR